jgi:hypothetical protein
LTSDDSPGWYFGSRLLCPAGQHVCSNPEKTSFQHWEWITDPLPGGNNTHSGAGAVKCTVSQFYPEDYPTEFGSSLRIRDSEFIPVEGGKTYTVSFWAKGDGITGGSPQVLIYQQDSTGKAVAGTSPGVNAANLRTGTYDWTQYFVSLRTATNTSQLTIKSYFRPGAYGSFTLDDFEIRRMDGALTNVIRTATSEIVIKSADGLNTYEEGSDYEIIDGELNNGTFLNGIRYSFYPLSEPTRVELLPGSNISPGESVKLQYDFALKLRGSANNSYWQRSYSINEATTYTSHVCPYIEDIMSELPSDYVFYRGADEIRGINRDSRNGSMENYELIAKDINNVYECVKQKNPHARMFIWNDMFDPWANGNDEYYQFAYGGKSGRSEPIDSESPRVTDLIPRQDLIPALWHYWPGDRRGQLRNSTAYFDNIGFEWIAAPSFNGMNIQEWAAAIADRPMNLGLIDTTWWGYSGLQKTANHVWNNQQVTFPAIE